MNKILFATAALIAFGFASSADAKPDHAERAGYAQTIRSVNNPAPVVVEGRNAATVNVAPATAGVEPYIANQIEQNERSR